MDSMANVICPYRLWLITLTNLAGKRKVAALCEVHFKSMELEDLLQIRCKWLLSLILLISVNGAKISVHFRRDLVSWQPAKSIQRPGPSTTANSRSVFLSLQHHVACFPAYLLRDLYCRCRHCYLCALPAEGRGSSMNCPMTP